MVCQSLAVALISLEYWWVGIASYALSHYVHIGWWKRHHIRQHLVPLAIVFGIPILVLPACLDFNPDQWVAPVLTHASLAAQYIAIYPAFQAISPTLEILDWLRKTKSASEEQILAACRERSPVGDRIRDLENGGLIVRQSNGFELSIRGRLLAQIFIRYRALLGLSLGAG